jgi:hypothetical protein
MSTCSKILLKRWKIGRREGSKMERDNRIYAEVALSQIPRLLSLVLRPMVVLIDTIGDIK